MSVVVAEKTVDLAVTFNGKEANGDVHATGKLPATATSALRLHFSLLGETEPQLSRLAAEYTMDEHTPAYRFDWLVGLTPLLVGGKWLDLFHALREKRAMAVQLLIDCGKSGCRTSEFAAHLLGLQPSMDTTSWMERNSEALSKSLREVAGMTAPVSGLAANVLNASALMSNFVGAGGRDDKHWFIYRFLDERRECAVIEWNIHRSVLEQYGPMLRGSLVLSFHGTWNRPNPITLLLRPKLGFGRMSEIDYLRIDEELETDNPVALKITPKAAADTPASA
jgi:hypothetical protein